MSEQPYVEPPTPTWLKVVLAILGITLVIAGLIVFWQHIVLILFGLIFFPFVWGALKAFIRL